MTEVKRAPCEHCGEVLSLPHDFHEVLAHPREREKKYPPEYVQWRREQLEAQAKKKRKKG